MKRIYLVYGYYTDIQRNVLMKICSSMKKAEEHKEKLMRYAEGGKIKHLYEVTIQMEYVD